MARQVSQSETTLLASVRQGDTPRPGLMSWQEWQTWRREFGQRPSTRVDGFTTTQGQESALWRSVMADLHGPDWTFRLVSRDVDMEPEADATDPSAEAPLPPPIAPPSVAAPVTEGQPSLPRSPQPAAGAPIQQATQVTDGQPSLPRLPQPAAGVPIQQAEVAEIFAPQTPRPTRVTVLSPGSGELPALTGPTGAAMPGGLQSPGSGAPSSDSWDSQNPGSPAGLTGKVLRGFDPTRETLTRYYERLFKQRAALETLGMPLVEGVYEGLRERAAIQSEVFTSSGPDPERFVRHLKRLFAMDYLDIDGTAEQMSRLDAMTSLMTDRGVDVEALRVQITAGAQAVAPSPAGPALNASPPRRPDSRERRLEAAGFGNARGPERFDISHDPGLQNNMTRRYDISTDPGLLERNNRVAMPASGFSHGEAEISFIRDRQRLEEELRNTQARLATAQLQVHNAERAGNLTPASADIGLLIDKTAEASARQTDALTAQTEMLKSVLERPAKKHSTFRIEPKVGFPSLGDDGPGGEEVKRFYERFEEVCDLANDGRGMPDKEMLMTLRNCLKGSCRLIYENVHKQMKHLIDPYTEEGYSAIYDAVKERLFKFLETETEKQLRVKGEWEAFTKTRTMSALQFEAEWERLQSDLNDVGLGLSKLDQKIQYILKIGPIADQVRMDRRPRPNSVGEMVVRLPETWEEMHEVLCEVEGTKSSSRAFQNARSGGLQPAGSPDAWPTDNGKKNPDKPQAGGQFGGGKDGGKGGNKGKGKGKDAGKGGKGDAPKGVCFRFRDTGECTRPGCPYDHSPQATGRTPQGALTRARKKEVAAEEQQAAGVKGDGKKGGGKAAAKAKAKAKAEATSPGTGIPAKKKIICREIKAGRECPNKDCEYGHKTSNFDENWKYTGGKKKTDNTGGSQDVVVKEEDNWDWDTPAGLQQQAAVVLLVKKEGSGVQVKGFAPPPTPPVPPASGASRPDRTRTRRLANHNCGAGCRCETPRSADSSQSRLPQPTAEQQKTHGVGLVSTLVVEPESGPLRIKEMAKKSVGKKILPWTNFLERFGSRVR